MSRVESRLFNGSLEGFLKAVLDPLSETPDGITSAVAEHPEGGPLLVVVARGRAAAKLREVLVQSGFDPLAAPTPSEDTH